MRKDLIAPWVILSLVTLAVSAGIFYDTPGSPIHMVTVRGDEATFQGSGLYAFDPALVAREGVIWDIVDLIVTVPLFAIAIALSARNSLRGRLLLAGFLAYVFYRYLMYATMSALNPMFLVYVVIFGLAPIAFVMNLRSIDVEQLPQVVSASFPRRLFIAYATALGVALVVMWLTRIVPIMTSGRFPSDIAGMTTLEVQALDLGLVVPLCFSTAYLLWRRSAWGYLLAALLLTFGMVMFIVIPAWIAVPLIQDDKINGFEAAPLLLLCAVGMVLAIRFFRAIRVPTPGPPLGR